MNDFCLHSSALGTDDDGQMAKCYKSIDDALVQSETIIANFFLHNCYIYYCLIPTISGHIYIHINIIHIFTILLSRFYCVN